MKTINLTVAILLAIKNFDDTSFSVANITTQLREDVNDGEYSIEKYEDNNIEHNEVRKAFVTLLENGFLDEYDIDYNTNTYIPYRLFTKKTAAKLPTLQLHLPPTNPLLSTPQKLTPIPAGTFGVPTSARPNPQASSAYNLNYKDQVKILEFVKGKGNVTTKRIQSAIKKYTCRDIKSFLEDAKILHPNAKTLDASKAYTIGI
jgi:hypothetical protein